MGWFGVVRGHPSLSTMSPLDRAHTVVLNTAKDHKGLHRTAKDPMQKDRKGPYRTVA